jgi:hypothetical protein
MKTALEYLKERHREEVARLHEVIVSNGKKAHEEAIEQAGQIGRLTAINRDLRGCLEHATWKLERSTR